MIEYLDNIRATSSVSEACAGTSLIINCVPAQNTPDFIAQNRDVSLVGVQ